MGPPARPGPGGRHMPVCNLLFRLIGRLSSNVDTVTGTGSLRDDTTVHLNDSVTASGLGMPRVLFVPLALQCACCRRHWQSDSESTLRLHSSLLSLQARRGLHGASGTVTSGSDLNLNSESSELQLQLPLRLQLELRLRLGLQLRLYYISEKTKRCWVQVFVVWSRCHNSSDLLTHLVSASGA